MAGEFGFRSYAIFVVRGNIMGGIEERFKSFNLCLLRGLCRGGQRFAGPEVIAAQKGTFFAEREQKTSTKPGTLRVPGIKLANRRCPDRRQRADRVDTFHHRQTLSSEPGKAS